MKNQYIELIESAIHNHINTTFKERPPSEEEFLAVANKLRETLQVIYPVSDSEYEMLLKRLKSYMVVKMNVGNCVKDKKVHQSWLPAKRADIEFFFWDRYKEYLGKKKKWNPRVIATLHRVSDEIVDLLGDPNSEDSFQRRGLVIGDVQSGKTANYTAICNKAADTGYRVIIVMAGMMENLRKQTQSRLDAEFSGRPSQILFTKNNKKEIRHQIIGVGEFGTEQQAAAFTSIGKDFNINTMNSNNLSLLGMTDPVYLVVKKNKNILTNLISWLKANNIDEGTGKIDLPMLLIDDEADNASVNTKGAEDPTAINKCIRDLLATFRQASYLGITATPFANIFIDPDTEDEMLGDDLFPRDFIYSLTPPSNYIGADRIFGDSLDQHDYLCPLYAGEINNFFPFKHKKYLTVTELPPSMIEAMAYFLLINGIRDIREDRTEHRSMMIHVSRFTNVQNQIAELVNEWLIQARSDIQNYAEIAEVPAKIESLKVMKSVWEKYQLEERAGVSWKKFLTKYLYRGVAPIDVRAVNQRTGATSLNYQSHQEDGLRVIAVGGNSLSRGLTLEGLCVSYFYRKSQMYDTLLQMGRWFGYRQGYDDLVKIWISEEAIDWYGYITAATNELKNEVSRMQYANQTPMEFGLKVRQDPSSLIVTAKNKMRAAVPVYRPISVSGKLLETPRLKADPTVLASNEKIFKYFIEQVNQTGNRKKDEKLYFWRNIDKSYIIQLLRNFETHPWHLSFQGSALADYIDKKMDNAGWDVVIKEGAKKTENYSFTCNSDRITIKPERRKVLVRDGQISISGTKVRVGSVGDAAIGLTHEERRRAEELFRKENPEAKNIPDSGYLIQGRRPLLLLHVIKVDVDNSTFDSERDIPDILFALAVGFPSTGDDTKTAKYMVNPIELKNWIDIEDDEE